MKTDLLADRHIGIQEEDLPAMLEKDRRERALMN